MGRDATADVNLARRPQRKALSVRHSRTGRTRHGQLHRVEARQLTGRALDAVILPLVEERLAGLGDTTAWVRRPQRWSLKLGDKQRGLDAGRLDAYLPHTPEAVRQQLVRLAPGDVLALTSDGVGDALADLPEAHNWFHRQWTSPVSAFELLLHINYDSHQRNDDRTAVVVWPWPPEGGRR